MGICNAEMIRAEMFRMLRHFVLRYFKVFRYEYM